MNSNVEVLCSSYYDAKQAAEAGIKDIELCCAPSLHALTPTLGCLKKVKENLDLNVVCTLRPRPGGFHYEEEDFEVMYEDAKILLENGADGLVFGFLNSDTTINKEQAIKFVDLIHSYNKKAIWNRAIDICKDINKAVEDLIEIGVDAILSSGGYIKAVEGVDVLKKLYKAYGDKIVFIAACDVNVDNAQYIIDNTGLTHLHYSNQTTKHDPTTSRFGVNFSYAGSGKYQVMDVNDILNLLHSLK